MDEQLPILIAEDNEDDAQILERALRKAGFRHPLHVSRDGADMIAYLKGAEPYSDREKFHFPRIIFTDLKMPVMDGFQVLKWLQEHPECNVIPRLVLSSSQAEKDVIRAYQLGVNSYLVKPDTFDQLVEQLRVVFSYWQICAKPPVPSRC
jgi:CheY-like chemotaxis protein